MGIATFRSVKNPAAAGIRFALLAGVLLLSDIALADLPGSVCLQPGMNVEFDECISLVNLYNLSSGDQWSDNTGWGSADVSGWVGLTVDTVGGHVLAIDLPTNGLVGILPSDLHFLTRLQTLNLSDNQLGGNIPDNLGDVPSLRNLDLSRNSFSGAIPASLGRLSALQNLQLFDNQLEGELPVELGALSNLRSFWFDGNQLSGPLPDELGDLGVLESLIGSDNAFSGPIPASIANLSQMRLLALSSNQLTGNLPACLGELSNLEALILFDNQLSGELPVAIGNLTNLDTLGLGQNLFYGELPESLVNLPLDVFFIDGNRFPFDPLDQFRNAIIPLALQAWFSGIAKTNIAFQNEYSDILFANGFEVALSRDLDVTPDCAPRRFVPRIR